MAVKYQCRDSVSIGSVTAGSKQTFSGLSLSVVTGDILGCFYTSGNMEETNSAGLTEERYISGEYIDPGDVASYTSFLTNRTLSLYGVGTGIDVGSPAIDRDSSLTPNWTMLLLDNPANATGTITSIEVWAFSNIGGLRVGTFYPFESPLPSVTTQATTAITNTTATGNGNILDIGTSSVTQHGHCWNTTGAPTTADSKTQNGAGVAGAFTSAMTGLTPNTLYYTRAYATNTSGTGYGEDVIFTTFIPKIFYF